MIRFAIPALLLGGALFSIQPADACHRFHVWKYPYPQRCDGAANRSTLNLRTVPPDQNTSDLASGVRDRRPLSRDIPSAVPLKDHSWFVEVAAEPIKPDPGDLRTPEQIQDFDEHYEAVAKYHDEINRQMIILHAREDAEKAAGIEGAR